MNTFKRAILKNLDMFQYRMKTILTRPSFFKEKAGVISKNELYVVIWGDFLYTGETILELMVDLTLGFWSSKNFAAGY